MDTGKLMVSDRQGQMVAPSPRYPPVVQADSNFTAHYYADNEDTDGDGVMDWFEYRMFGDLSRNPSDDSDGDGFPTSVRASSDRMH